MAESIVQVTEGVGKKLHSWQRTVGANNVEDEAVFPAEFPLASYTVQADFVSLATATSHVLQIMAGAALNVRIRKITVQQYNEATAAAKAALKLFRLTTAGTGGTVLTPSKMDNGDAAAGATAMTLPTVVGATGAELFSRSMLLTQTVPVGGGNMPGWEWTQHPGMKPIIIPAGAANGIALVTQAGTAAATVIVTVEFVETSFL